MSLHPQPIGDVPAKTVHIARAAFPKRPQEREALALEIGGDGFVLLEAVDAPNAPDGGSRNTDGSNPA